MNNPEKARKGHPIPWFTQLVLSIYRYTTQVFSWIAIRSFARTSSVNQGNELSFRESTNRRIRRNDNLMLFFLIFVFLTGLGNSLFHFVVVNFPHRRTTWTISTKLKEALAGCSLKNRLREFIFIFAYVLFMVFRVYLCKKKHASQWL